jgi:hypothetical protein
MHTPRLLLGVRFACARALLLGAASLLLSSCSGGEHTVPAQTTQPASSARATANFTIAIPNATSTASARRAPRYVSPATASITVNITTDPGGTSVVHQNVPLTTGSQGCTSNLVSTVCTLTLALNPGTYDAAISTYDAGNTELSGGQLVHFSILEGQANTIALTLSGIPAALHVSSPALAVHGSQSTGFTLYGLAPQHLLVEALDADGNVIVGPGAPTFTLAAVSGSGFTIANPTSAAPNTFALTPPGTSGQGETFSVTAAYTDGTCALTGAVCNTSFAVKNDIQTLFVANYNSSQVTEYAPPYTSPPVATISNAVAYPMGLALDGAGHLFIANYNFNISASTVTEYAPPYTAAPIATITNSVNYPAGVALDGAGNLFVANQGAGTVTEYAPPYTSAPIATITNGVSQPAHLALDGAGNLFVPNYANSNGSGSGTVTEYAPPYTSGPVATITNSVSNPDGLALDAAGDLFVANYIGTGTGTVTEYAPPYTSAPIAMITNGVNLPSDLALDGAGDLFVTNYYNNTVTEYAPPYTSAPIATISNSVSQPYALVFTP